MLFRSVTGVQTCTLPIFIPVMLILVGVALVGVLVGFFNPGLSYGG